MKRLILAALVTIFFVSTAFVDHTSISEKANDVAQEEKTVTITLSVDEINVVYIALGKLPAEQVEALRVKLKAAYDKQIGDSTSKKPRQ